MIVASHGVVLREDEFVDLEDQINALEGGLMFWAVWMHRSNSPEFFKRLIKICSKKMFKAHNAEIIDEYMLIFVELMPICPRLRELSFNDVGLLTSASIVPLFRQLACSKVHYFEWRGDPRNVMHDEVVLNELVRHAPVLKFETFCCYFHHTSSEFCVKLLKTCAQMRRLRKLLICLRPPFVEERIELVIAHLVELSHLDQLIIPLLLDDESAIKKRLTAEINRHIRPGIPQIIALCHVRRYGKVENGRQICALRRIPVDLLRMLGPMLVRTNGKMGGVIST